MEYTKRELYQILKTLEAIPHKERGYIFKRVHSVVAKMYYANREERKSMSLSRGGDIVHEIFNIPFEDLPLYINGSHNSKHSLSSYTFLEMIKIRLKLGR